METESEKLQEADNTTPETKTKVGFPEQGKKKNNKSSRNLVIFLIIVLVLLGGGAWYLFGTGSDEEISVSSPTPVMEEQFTPTPTEEPEINKSEIKIQVLNGTGITGAAGDLKDELEEIDYEDIEVGNATTQDNSKTSVSYKTGLSESIKDELTKKLEDLYEEVVVEEKTMDEFEIMIVTGYPKGHKVTATPTEKITATVTPTDEPTSTPTEEITPTL